MPPNWEIWLDNHFSPVIAKWLSEEHNMVVRSSYTLQLHGLNDLQVYQKAKNAGNIILISKDSDLKEIISGSGAPPKLLAVKFGNCSNKTMFHFISTRLDKAVRLLTTFDIDFLDLE